MAGTPTQEKGSGRRGGGPRPLAASMGGVARRTLGRRGFAEGGLIADWRAIVGAELAASCWPDRISFPPGKRGGGTLRIRVAGGLATELQHLTPQLLERVNGHFGYRAIDRISLLQAPPDENSASQTAPKTRSAACADPRREGEFAAATAAVDDPDLRAALARLGRAMISDAGGDGR